MSNRFRFAAISRPCEYAWGSVVTDVAETGRLAERNQAEYLHFRRYLRTRLCPDEPFRILAKEVERQIDCTQCANCCRHLIVNVTDADIGAIAAYLNVPTEAVVRLYTTADPAAPSRRILINTREACTFLDGNLCVIYEARPRACREFPHASLRARSLGGRLESLCNRAALCPIVYNTIELYKKRIGYRANSPGRRP